MDFPCAASSCMLFTVPLLIMAAISCVDENNISHKSTALLGVGQIFYYCSPVNYNLLLTQRVILLLFEIGQWPIAPLWRHLTRSVNAPGIGFGGVKGENLLQANLTLPEGF